MRNILIMSDIHGNLSALEAVFKAESLEEIEGIILLGDVIDYGPRSDEVIQKIREIPDDKILVNLWGNHEAAIYKKDYSRFSSERGIQSAVITGRQLKPESMDYLGRMERTGRREIEINDYRCLMVHGSLQDCFWGNVSHQEKSEEYSLYDIVFSGHSHIPHFFCHYYPSVCSELRNKKRTIFINPGSVGQPRDHNPNAHYAVIEMETLSVCLKSVCYDIDYEMSLFTGERDIFYRERLKRGV